MVLNAFENLVDATFWNYLMYAGEPEARSRGRSPSRLHVQEHSLESRDRERPPEPPNQDRNDISPNLSQHSPMPLRNLRPPPYEPSVPSSSMSIKMNEQSETAEIQDAVMRDTTDGARKTTDVRCGPFIISPDSSVGDSPTTTHLDPSIRPILNPTVAPDVIVESTDDLYAPRSPNPAPSNASDFMDISDISEDIGYQSEVPPLPSQQPHQILHEHSPVSPNRPSPPPSHPDVPEPAPSVRTASPVESDDSVLAHLRPVETGTGVKFTASKLAEILARQPPAVRNIQATQRAVAGSSRPFSQPVIPGLPNLPAKRAVKTETKTQQTHSASSAAPTQRSGHTNIMIGPSRPTEGFRARLHQ